MDASEWIYFYDPSDSFEFRKNLGTVGWEMGRSSLLFHYFWRLRYRGGGRSLGILSMMSSIWIRPLPYIRDAYRASDCRV